MSIEELFEILLSDKPGDLIKSHEEAVFDLIPELKICNDLIIEKRIFIQRSNL